MVEIHEKMKKKKNITRCQTYVIHFLCMSVTPYFPCFNYMLSEQLVMCVYLNFYIIRFCVMTKTNRCYSSCLNFEIKINDNPIQNYNAFISHWSLLFYCFFFICKFFFTNRNISALSQAIWFLSSTPWEAELNKHSQSTLFRLQTCKITQLQQVQESSFFAFVPVD